MEILRFALAGVVAAGVLGAGVAGAATMHPVLAAKLAGMGEHGVVNVDTKAHTGELRGAMFAGMAHRSGV